MTADALARKRRDEAHTEPLWSAQFDAPVNHAVALEESICFLCGDGAARFVMHMDLDERHSQLHAGAILSAAKTGSQEVMTGGDDGRVMLSDAAGNKRCLAEHKGQWVNSVASSAMGELAWAAGRTCHRRTRDGKLASLECPATPSVIAFDPKGRRLAIAQYGGVWLWLPKMKEDLVRRLEWKGSHINLTWSPDGRNVLTAMQENELHGWRLSDGAQMRMAGYPGKIHALSWNVSGSRLATSGAPAAVLWPFEHGGPWNRAPEEMGFLAAGIRRLAWHPGVDVLAIGCALGGVQLVRATDGSQKTLRSEARHAVSAITWARSGQWLAIGTEDGSAQIYSFTKA